jgi:hypothetical protein
MANFQITYRARVTMTVEAETEQDALREAERRARIIEHDETIVRGLPVYIGGFDTQDPDEIERDDAADPCARCGGEVPNPRRGTFGDVLCDGCISGLNDALDAVQDEQWGPDSAQQALERGPR